VRGESTAYRGVLFVDEAGPLRALGHLAGKSVAWVDPTSASGYLHPRLHLARRGIDVETFLGRQEFAGSHGEAVRAVASGRVDVAATFAERPCAGAPIQRAGFVEAAAGRAVRVLEWTDPIPNDLVIAHGQVKDKQCARFEQALFTLGESGPELLRAAFRAECFAPPARGALDRARDLVRTTRAEGLLPHL
jgi:phosphonate transport system substrate-binding protein